MKKGRQGFTILELLVASTVLAIILFLVASVIGRTGTMWTTHRDRATAFEAASAAFDRMTKTLAQATLNTYWQVIGERYGRSSELHFVLGSAASLVPSVDAALIGSAVFFQAPLGRSASPDLRKLTALMNGTGYFTAFNDTPVIPEFFETFAAAEPRFRLYEWIEGTEINGVFHTIGAGPLEWFRGDFAGNQFRNAHVLAENVIGLVILAEYPQPDGASTTRFEYDSRDVSSAATLHQLPPILHLAMVVIDENSARRLADRFGSSPPPITALPGWFQDPSRFNEDLVLWEQLLADFQPKINFRVFHATLGLPAAKWSL